MSAPVSAGRPAAVVRDSVVRDSARASLVPRLDGVRECGLCGERRRHPHRECAHSTVRSYVYYVYCLHISENGRVRCGELKPVPLGTAHGRVTPRIPSRRISGMDAGSRQHSPVYPRLSSPHATLCPVQNSRSVVRRKWEGTRGERCRRVGSMDGDVSITLLLSTTHTTSAARA